MNATTTQPMTAAQFVARHGHESGVELVEGYIRRLPMPGGEHGVVCSKANYHLTRYALETASGRVMGNDTFVRTRIDPPTYRGADVCYLSYERLPKDQPSPKGPLETPPDLVVEVKSPTDRWGDIRIKVGEYETAGVRAVVVLDPELGVATVYRGEELPQRFHNGDEFTLPDVLPGFAVPVARFFE